MAFKREREDSSIAFPFWFQFSSVIQIEIARTVLRRNRHLPAPYVVLISIDNGPDSLRPRGPAAGVDTIPMHRVKGLPTLTRQEARDASLDGCHAASGLGVSWRDAVPNSPKVFTMAEDIIRTTVSYSEFGAVESCGAPG